MKFGQIALAATLALLLLGSVAIKISQLSVPGAGDGAGDGVDQVQVTDERAVDFLRGHGFEPTGTVVLSSDGNYRAFSLQKGGCSGPVYVSRAPINGETLDLLYQLADNDSQVLFGYRGAIYQEPPIIRAYLAWKIQDVLSAMKLSATAPQSDMLMVIAPRHCSGIDALPWQDFSSLPPAPGLGVGG
jgi:hypothetical protein